MTPLVAFIILTNINLSYYISSRSPYSFVNSFATPCEKYWWSALLHIQTYANPNEMCLQYTWYISDEWQMFILTPFIAFIAYKFGSKVFYGTLTILILSSICVGFKLAFDYGMMVNEQNVTIFVYKEYHRFLYHPTHIRGSAYLIGMLLGYNLFKKSQTNSTASKISFEELSENSNRNLFRSRVIVLVIIVLFIANTYVLNIFGEFIPLIMHAFLIACGRNIWAVLLSVLIYLYHDNSKGAFNQFLSCQKWKPIGKLGLSLYLVSALFQYHLTASSNRPIDIDSSAFFRNVVTNFTMSIIASIFLYLLIEVPFIKLGKLIAEPNKRANEIKNVLPALDIDAEKIGESFRYIQNDFSVSTISNPK